MIGLPKGLLSRPPIPQLCLRCSPGILCLSIWLSIPLDVGAETLTLKQLLEKAQAGNPRLQSHDFSAQRFESLAQQSTYPANPMVSLSYLPGMQVPSQNLTVTQRFHLPGTYQLAKTSFLHQKEERASLRVESHREITYQITYQYAKIFSLQRRLRFLESYLKWIKALSNSSAYSLSAQPWRSIEALSLQMALSRAQMNRRIYRAQQTLKAYLPHEVFMQQPIQGAIQNIKLVDDSSNELTSVIVINENLQNLSLDPPGAIEALSLQIKARDHQLSYWRTQASLQHWHHGVQGQIGAGVRLSGAPPAPPYSLTLGVSVPVWRRKYSAKARAALQQAKAQQLNSQVMKHDLAAQLAYLLYSVESRSQSLKLLAGELITLSQYHLDSSREALGAGRSSVMEVLQPRQSLYQLRQRYYGDFLQLIHDAAMVEKLTGKKVIRVPAFE